VVTCSALKKAYRDRLRQGSPTLAFVFLDIEKQEALRRVIARQDTHFFSANLVESQFAALERPDSEPLVLRLDATAPLNQLQAQVSDWIEASIPN
jgi:gluconokinase